MQVEVLSTEELGDRSYVAHDGATAVVVDPQRDIDRVEAVLDRLGVTVGLVLETHIHNDYVTGGYELARRTGARYAVNAEDRVGFERTPVTDGDVLEVGALRVQALATPGHTFTHLSYAVSDTARPEEPPVVFTGGSLLYGSVGRPDLLGTEHTDALARAQFRSARKLVGALPESAAVYPTHGFGSFCSAGSATGGDGSTLGDEKARNDALTTADEDAFVKNLVANLTGYPAYYAHMAPLNQKGPAVPALTSPSPVDPAELGRRIAAGEWVVDLRDRVAYAADHVAGTISIALGTQFATYVGWLMPWGAPLTLVGESPQQVADAQRQLMRIGIDGLAGAATGGLDAVAAGLGRASYPCVDFAETARTKPADDVVLDVRRDDERAHGSIAGSVHVPLNDLLSRMPDVPDARLWVHCGSGFRAGIAASLLQRAGHDVVHIDDDYGNAEKSGFELTG